MRKKKSVFGSIDWFTIILFLVLLGLGWTTICGACYDFDGMDNLLMLSTRTGMQALWIGVSLSVALLIMLTDDRIFDTFSFLFYGAMMILLLVTPIIGTEIKGSHSWIKVGSFSLQPAEFAKCATSLAIAKFMSSYGFSLMGSWRNLVGSFFIILLPMALIVMQRETGSALVYFSLFLMFYREGLPGSILFAGVSAVLYFVIGIRFADQLILNNSTSLGTFLVLLMILFFTAGMLYIYSPRSKDGDRKARNDNLTPMANVLAYGLGTTALATLFCVYVHPFNVAALLLIVMVALAGYLVVHGLLSHIYRYCYIGLFAFGSLAFFYSAHTILYKVLEPHQQKRVLVLLGLKDDPKGTGYNVIQAQIAIGSGGLKGKGFLNGTQTKLKYVPEQETDFIFCTVGEEQGFIGSAGVLVLFLVLLLRILHVAERQPYAFGRVYGYCVFSIFFFHVLINIGMVLGLAPVIGIPLPFFSYGGSSLLGFTLLLFILLRIDAGRNRMER